MSFASGWRGTDVLMKEHEAMFNNLKIKSMGNSIPRKNRLDLNTPAELAIRNAMTEVEKAGASEQLTNAIIKLQEAFDLVADWEDNKDERPI